MALNKVALQGNLCRRPEFADTRGDMAILNFTVAHSRKYKKKEDVSFVDCVAYGKSAENIGKFFDKGDPILVIGRLTMDQWEDRDGGKRSKLKITVEEFHFTGSTGDRQGGSGGNRGGNQGRGGGRDNRDDQGSDRNYDNRTRNRNDDRGDRGRNERQDGGGRNSNDDSDDVPF